MSMSYLNHEEKSYNSFLYLIKGKCLGLFLDIYMITTHDKLQVRELQYELIPNLMSIFYIFVRNNFIRFLWDNYKDNEIDTNNEEGSDDEDEDSKNQKTKKEVLCAVPKRFPALMRSSKVQNRARKVGFDWNDAEEALPKVYEELDELKAAMRGDGSIAEEAGDLLFAIVNVVRLLGFDSEQLLHDATDKFIARFGRMEELAAQDGFQLDKLTLKEQDRYWEKAKKSQISE